MDLLLFGGLALIATAGGLGMSSLQDYLRGDWQEVRDCRDTYWTCDVEWHGVSRTPSNRPVAFSGTAKRCDEYRAYLVAAERAKFDCAMSRRVAGGSCAEAEYECTLPDTAY